MTWALPTFREHGPGHRVVLTGAAHVRPGHQHVGGGRGFTRVPRIFLLLSTVAAARDVAQIRAVRMVDAKGARQGLTLVA